MRHRLNKLLLHRNRHIPQGPDWRTVAQWALGELLEVPMVNIELPLAELDRQLEDVMEEEGAVESSYRLG